MAAHPMGAWENDTVNVIAGLLSKSTLWWFDLKPDILQVASELRHGQVEVILTKILHRDVGGPFLYVDGTVRVDLGKIPNNLSQKNRRSAQGRGDHKPLFAPVQLG